MLRFWNLQQKKEECVCVKIIDLHCDALSKLWEFGGRESFLDSAVLDANKKRLKEGKIIAQAFAIWIDPAIKLENKFQAALEQAHIFYSEILNKNDDIKHIKNWSELKHLQDGQIAAILTLEGVDCIGNDIKKLEILFELGVRLVGLTWNEANLAADGAGEPRGAGLTEFGREIVRLNNDKKIFTDVSHLSERAFWDVMELADYPIASHSNTKKYCDHPRNLSDQQAEAMFKKGGMVHVVYYPDFIKSEGSATISDLIKHIDHLCSLGGEKQIGFGSDFDGISRKVSGLANASQTQNLINELLKYFSEDQVLGFACENFLSYCERMEHNR